MSATLPRHSIAPAWIAVGNRPCGGRLRRRKMRNSLWIVAILALLGLAVLVSYSTWPDWWGGEEAVSRTADDAAGAAAEPAFPEGSSPVAGRERIPGEQPAAAPVLEKRVLPSGRGLLLVRVLRARKPAPGVLVSVRSGNHFDGWAPSREERMPPRACPMLCSAS